MASCCLQKVTTLISTPDGRDKAHGILEKGAKLLLFLLASKKMKPELVVKLTAFANQIMITRGVNRLFSGSQPLYGLINSINQPNKDLPDAIRYTQMIIMIGWIGFFYFDNKIFLGLTGLLKNVNFPHAGKRASQLWFFCLFLTIILNYLHYNSLNKDDESDDNKKVIKVTKLKLIAGLMEIVCAAGGSGFFQINPQLNDSLMFGSAAIGIKRILL